jgi:hypothetical protein
MSETYDIKVIDIVDQEDGSAIMQIEFCPEAGRLLIEAGIISLLRKHIDEIEDASKTD